MDAGRPLYFLLVLLWIGVTGLNANVGTLILLIKAAFPFMRIICPTDFVRVTNSDQTIFNVSFLMCGFLHGLFVNRPRKTD